ncbi:MAG: alpha/beta hydrolase [Promethearchaeota archaeon]
MPENVKKMLKKPVVLRLPDMDKIQVHRDLLYKETDEIDLKFDVYEPRDLESGERRGVVIFVHGGVPIDWLKDFDSRSWGQYQGWGRLVATSGLIGVTFTRRPEFSEERGSARFNAAVNDIDDLIIYIRKHANELSINKNLLGIWACSAGVPTGFRAGILHSSEYIKCMVALYGLLDLRQRPDSISVATHPSWIRNAPEKDLKEFSPLYHMEKFPSKVAPLLVIKAGRDHETINCNLNHFVKEASRINLDIEFINYPDGQHAFDILDDTDRSQQIMQRTLSFMKEHLL